MAKKTLLNLLRDQFTRVPPVVNNVNLKGKTAIVVGANTGLGFEAAKHFAKMDAGRLILACRNRERGEAAIQRLREATGYSRANLWMVDLAEFASVRAFVDRAVKDLERLDILLLNAAIASTKPEYKATVDGWEQTLQVNDLSLSLLGILLLPRMLETAKQYGTTPRTVVVTSEVHYWAKIAEEVLKSPNAFDMLGSKEYCTLKILATRYLDSKLLNIFFVRALSNRLKNQPLIVNSVNPGFCYSEIHRDMNPFFVRVSEKLLARQTEEGSRQLVWAAVGTPNSGGGEPALDKLRGAYINLSDIEEPADFLLGEEGKKREEKLWMDLISVLERVDPRVKNAVSRYLAAAADERP